MIYIGLKKFRKALELLDNVSLPPVLVSSVASCLHIYRLPIYIFTFQAVTAPMSSLNAITIEAYKKYVLVSLIQNGQVFHLHPMLLNDSTFSE
jgi:COP9 signalosome complex subunit 3